MHNGRRRLQSRGHSARARVAHARENSTLQTLPNPARAHVDRAHEEGAAVIARRRLLGAMTASGAALALSACGSRRRRTKDTETPPLRLRVWSEPAATAYREALSGFQSTSGLAVEVESQPWDDYWASLPLDVADRSAPDLLWMNTANLAQLQANEVLLDVGELVGDATSAIEPITADMYRIDEALWGLPQLWERTVLVANRNLTEAAGVDPSALACDPSAPSDALRDAARSITVDEGGRHPGDEGFDVEHVAVTGFSSHPDRSALLGPFIAAHGGHWQNAKGQADFASPEGIAAVQYLADLALKHQVAPPGELTVSDPSLCRQRFVEGTLGLLQTGTYDLDALQAGIDGSFPWDLHPPVAGPHGVRPLVHAIALVAVRPKKDERTEAIGELLAHLATLEAQRPLAEARLGIPAHRDLRGAWEQAWKDTGVDVSVLGDAPTEIAWPERGVRSAEAVEAAMGPIAEVFTGQKPAQEALPEAQTAARDAVG